MYCVSVLKQILKRLFEPFCVWIKSTLIILRRPMSGESEEEKKKRRWWEGGVQREKMEGGSRLAEQ